MPDGCARKSARCNGRKRKGIRNMKKLATAVAFAAALAGYAEVYPNYALRCEAFASSLEWARNPAELAVDGLTGTRWSSGRTDDEWITLDLGEQRRIGRIVLNWERSAGARYTVRVSPDNEHYEDVFSETEGKQGAYQVIDFRPRDARYVRVDCRERTTEYGFSLWEIEVYPPVKNLAYRCRMGASAALPDDPASNAADGSPETGWRAPAGPKPQWIQLELGGVRNLGKIVLDWGKVGAKKYTVEVSEDGKRYTAVHSREDGKAGEVETVRFAPQRFRYVRVNCIQPLGSEGYGLNEIEAYPK